MSELKSIDDLLPDDRNANAGTERGQYMVTHSLEQYGAGRSILVDKNGRIIAGNKTHQAALEKGMEITVVPSDGRSLVVVQRTDLDLDDPRARELAIADNRASEVGLVWDASVLASLGEEGVDLSGLFFEHELDAILSAMPDADAWDAALGGLPAGDRAPFQQMTFTLSDEQAEQVKAALDRAKHLAPFVDTGNENSNGNALARVCEVFLGQG